MQFGLDEPVHLEHSANVNQFLMTQQIRVPLSASEYSMRTLPSVLLNLESQKIFNKAFRGREKS